MPAGVGAGGEGEDVRGAGEQHLAGGDRAAEAAQGLGEDVGEDDGGVAGRVGGEEEEFADF